MPSQLLIFFKYIIYLINALSEWSGRLIAWLILFMVLIIVYQATMVALFSIGSVALQELQWHLFALVFLFGAAYTLKHDDHVRVDIIYQGHWMNDYRRAWLDFLGGLFLLLPFCLLVIVSSWEFVYRAFATCQSNADSTGLHGLWEFIYTASLTCEGSADPGGLPFRFLLKAAIPLGFGLLMLQGIANSLTSLLYILESQEEKH
jgi:TRAP-type mannitol/chloroaromatic compound transport system permease small subunit